MLGAFFYVSFATQKRKIIREGTPRALKLRWWLFLKESASTGYFLPLKSKRAETFRFSREDINLL
jgi:hypothetical protein